MLTIRKFACSCNYGDLTGRSSLRRILPSSAHLRTCAGSGADRCPVATGLLERALDESRFDDSYLARFPASCEDDDEQEDNDEVEHDDEDDDWDTDGTHTD